MRTVRQGDAGEGKKGEREGRHLAFLEVIGELLVLSDDLLDDRERVAVIVDIRGVHAQERAQLDEDVAKLRVGVPVFHPLLELVKQQLIVFLDYLQVCEDVPQLLLGNEPLGRSVEQPVDQPQRLDVRPLRPPDLLGDLVPPLFVLQPKVLLPPDRQLGAEQRLEPQQLPQLHGIDAQRFHGLQ